MTEIQKAWLAGIVDGEGHLNIVRDKPPLTSPFQNPRHRLFLKITMGHLPTIQKIHELTECGHLLFNRPQKETHNGAYTWASVSNDAIKIVRDIFPYLVTKKTEAEIAIEFGNLPRNRVGRKGIPPEWLEARENCRCRLIAARTRYHTGRINMLLLPPQ